MLGTPASRSGRKQVGSLAAQNADSVAIAGGSITGITDLAVADGGTGSSTASGARTNLGAAAQTPLVETVSTLTDGATPALDASLGNIFVLVAAGDRTIAVPTNATSGQKIVIRHNASGGARTLALNTGANGFRFGSDITALTQTVSAKTDYIGCIWNSTDSKWDVVAYTKGF